MTTDEFLGNTIINKYQSIYPLLRLMLNRMEDVINNGIEASTILFWPESYTLHDKITIKEKIAIASGFAPYYIHRLLVNTAEKKKDSIKHDSSNILFSDTILDSDRYSEFQKKLKKREDIVGISTIWNHRLSRRVPWKFARAIYLDGSIIEKKTREEILVLFEVLLTIKQSEKKCEVDNEVLMQQLEVVKTIFNNRIEVIKQLLNDFKVRLYITANPYRVEEILIIMSCKLMGIVTCEWLHHSYFTLKIPLKEDIRKYVFEDDYGKLSFTDRLYVWCEADKKWIDKYVVIHSESNDLPLIKVVGSPEIDRDDIKNNMRKFKRKNAVIFFVPTNSHFSTGDEKVNLTILKKRIYSQLLRLKKINNAEIYIRFHPGLRSDDFDGEQEFCKKIGFHILNDNRKSFIKGLCISSIAITTVSAALFVAENYGCTCYAIKQENNTDYDFIDRSIKMINIDDIPNINAGINDTNKIDDTVKMDVLLSPL